MADLWPITGNQCFFYQTAEMAGGQKALMNNFLVGIGEGEQSMEPLDMSVLATLGTRKYRRGDLIEPGQFELRCLFDVDDSDDFWGWSAGDKYPGNRWDVFIQYQKTNVTQSAATLEGPGFVVNRVWPELINDQLAEARILWQFDGFTGYTTPDHTQTGPTYTEPV